MIIFLYNHGYLVAEARGLAIKIDDLRHKTHVLIVLMSAASSEERQKENVRGCGVSWPPGRTDVEMEEVKNSNCNS